MKFLDHNFILIPIKDRLKYNLNESEFDKFCICKKCNMIVYMETEKKLYYYWQGISESSFVRLSCKEYIIKKLLE